MACLVQKALLSATILREQPQTKRNNEINERVAMKKICFVTGLKYTAIHLKPWHG